MFTAVITRYCKIIIVYRRLNWYNRSLKFQNGDCYVYVLVICWPFMTFLCSVYHCFSIETYYLIEWDNVYYKTKSRCFLHWIIQIYRVSRVFKINYKYTKKNIINLEKKCTPLVMHPSVHSVIALPSNGQVAFSSQCYYTTIQWLGSLQFNMLLHNRPMVR